MSTKTVLLRKTRHVRKLSVASSATANLSFRLPLGELTLTSTANYLSQSSGLLFSKRHSSVTMGSASLMNGFKNSGTGQSLKKMTKLLLHSLKLDRSSTATLNSQRTGRQCSIAALSIQPTTLVLPIQGMSQMESRLGKLLIVSILVLTKTISGSGITQILTTTIALNCMSIACRLNSLKCSASDLSLVSSSRKILMATIKLIQKTLRLTKCSP